MSKKLVETIEDVKIYVLAYGIYSVEVENLKTEYANSYEDARKIAVSLCE